MIGAEVKFEFFFDREKVIAATSRKNRRVLGRTGAFGRRVMRPSIKSAGKKGKKSAPGEAPRSHVNRNHGLRLILFSYDKQSESVAIGPLKFNAVPSERGMLRTVRTVPTGNKTVPQLLNEGGTATQTTSFPSGVVQTRAARYRPRPFRDLAMPPTQAFFKKVMAEEAFK